MSEQLKRGLKETPDPDALTPAISEHSDKRGGLIIIGAMAAMMVLLIIVQFLWQG